MSTHNPMRRNVLRGIVAAGCAVCLQRAIAAEPQSGKMEKAQAKYQNGPNGDQQCSGCMHFMPGSNACKLVTGDISPNGWCTLWTAKQG